MLRNVFKPLNILFTFGVYKFTSFLSEPIQGFYNYYIY